jgi:ribosomal protein L12E/L44/L45/RPP1/RPP2
MIRLPTAAAFTSPALTASCNPKEERREKKKERKGKEKEKERWEKKLEFRELLS